MNDFIPTVLTIAGSDSGGGAGIQADLRTFNAFGVYGCSVITAITSQNPDEVRRVDILPAESVKCQTEAILDLFPVRYAKTGMLANREIIECVAEQIKKYSLQLIVDPVMVSTSGTKLLEESAISALKETLFPVAQWITPNIPEAELLCGRRLKYPGDLAEAASELYNEYHCNIILKSGHLEGNDEVADIVCYHGQLFSLSSPVAEVSGNTAHGTGCTLSAALVSNFAWNKSWKDTLTAAKAFVFGSLCENRKLSKTLSQMYPPKQNCFNKITVKEL